MNENTLKLFFSILTIFLFYRGSSLLIHDILYSAIPYAVLTASAIVLGLYLFSVPPPDPRDVLEVVGRDPGLMRDDSPSLVKVIAHRGAYLDYPENSLIAFKMCSDKGCDFIEFDVMLTRDHVPIIFHDVTLTRLTGLNLVVHETNWEELSKIDIAHTCPHNQFANVRIPTLDEGVCQLLAYGQKMIIDIKGNDTRMVSVILNLFKKYPELKTKSIVSAFFPNIIYMIRRRNRDIICSLAWKPHEFAYDDSDGCRKRSDLWYVHYFLESCDKLHGWALPRITYYFLGLSVILLHKDSVSGEDIINWRKKGVRVMTWTVNTITEKQYLERNLMVTYLTDTLDDETNTVCVG